MKKTDKNDNDPDNDNVTASRKRIPKKKPLKNTTEQKIIGGFKNTYGYADASITCQQCAADPTGH